MGRIPPT